jgi:flagellar motor switch protein FliM
VERLARDQIAGSLISGFASVTDLDVTLDYVAADAAEAAIANPPSPCLAWRISLTVEERDGSLTFLLPYAAIEPIRPQLSRDPAGSGRDSDAAWRNHLEAELPHTDVALRAVIERRRVSATEVLRWRIGSTVVLNRRHDEPIDVFCDDLLVLRARMAEHDGRIALHVEERRLAEDWPVQT